MMRIALDCFEDQPDGSWLCRRYTKIMSRGGEEIAVKRNQLFTPGATFAATTILRRAL